MSNIAPRATHSLRGVIDVLNAIAARGDRIVLSCKKNAALAQEDDFIRPAQLQANNFSADAHQVSEEVLI